MLVALPVSVKVPAEPKMALETEFCISPVAERLPVIVEPNWATAVMNPLGPPEVRFPVTVIVEPLLRVIPLSAEMLPLTVSGPSGESVRLPPGIVAAVAKFMEPMSPGEAVSAIDSELPLAAESGPETVTLLPPLFTCRVELAPRVTAASVRLPELRLFGAASLALLMIGADDGPTVTDKLAMALG